MAGILDDDFHPSFNSSADQDEFPDNRPDSFQVKLPCQFQFFNEEVKVALHYISIPTKWKVINDNNDTFETRKVIKTVNEPYRKNHISKIREGKFLSQVLNQVIEQGHANFLVQHAKFVADQKRLRAEAISRGEDVGEEEHYEREDSVAAYYYEFPDSLSNFFYPTSTNEKGIKAEISRFILNQKKELDVRSYFRFLYLRNLHSQVLPYFTFEFKIDDDIFINDIPNKTFEIEIKIKPEVIHYQFSADTTEAFKNWGIPEDKIGKRLTEGFSFRAPNFINPLNAVTLSVGLHIPPRTPYTLTYSQLNVRKIEQGWWAETDVFLKHVNELADFRTGLPSVSQSTSHADVASVSTASSSVVGESTHSEIGEDSTQNVDEPSQRDQEVDIEEQEEEGEDIRGLFSLTKLGHMKLDIPLNFEIKFNGLLGNLLGFPSDEWISNTSAYTVSKKMFTLHPVTSFYLYCNILKPVITSGRFTELLSEIVPHREIPGTASSDVTPYYPIRLAYKRLPLNSSFNIIGFKITDQYGQDVDFIGCETSIQLHFVRTKKKYDLV